MAQVDLHLHTTRSDGTLSPSQLVRLCAERGLKVISISDHDSTEGIAEALEAARGHPDLTIIPGVELSTDAPGSEIHILGYFVDPLDDGFQATLRGFRESRHTRVRKMVEALRDQGIAVSFERVEELSAGGSIGRPHIAQALVEAGYVRYPREAFDRYLGSGGPAYVGHVKLTPDDAVRFISEAGGLAVMAHPTYSVSKSDRDEVASVRQTLARLKQAGLVGVEVYYSDYTPEQVRWLAGLADELGLVPCGGSDYHASGNPGEPEPGSVGPPMSTIESLMALRSRERGYRMCWPERRTVS